MALWVVASPHSRGLADCVGLRGFWPRFWRGGLLKMDIKSDKITHFLQVKKHKTPSFAGEPLRPLSIAVCHASYSST